MTLGGIEFHARGGVSQAEKEIAHRYRARVDLYLDLGKAGSSDALEDTIDYADVYRLVVDTARERPFNLVEALAARILERILQRFTVDRVTLEIQKLHPPIDGVVAYEAVEMTRSGAQPPNGV